MTELKEVVLKDGKYALVYVMGGNIFVAYQSQMMWFKDGRLTPAEKPIESKNYPACYHGDPYGAQQGFVKVIDSMMGEGWIPLGSPSFAGEYKIYQALVRK